MMPPMARTPKTSGIAFTTMVSEAANPTPRATSAPSSPSPDGTRRRTTSPNAWIAQPARMVLRVPMRSEIAPAARRPTTEPMP